MPSLAPELLPELLREAVDPNAPPAPTAAELRAAAVQARQAITQVLKDRAVLLDATDADIARLIDQALGRVLATLAAQPSDYQLWVLPRLVDSIKRIADQLATEAGQQASTAIGKAWTLGARAVDAPLAGTASAALPGALAAQPAVPGLGTASLAQLRALQVMTTSQIGGASTSTVAAINRELGQVVLGVQAPVDAQRAVGALLTDRTRSQLRAIVGLGLGQAFNTASYQRLAAQAQRDPGIKKMWRRSGKRHARWNHDAIDGTVLPVDEAFTLQPHSRKGGPVAIMYPADPAAPIGETINCGCVLIPWKSTWGMQYKGAKPYTAQERADRGLGPNGEVLAKPAPTRAPKPAKPATTQDKALAAFGATPTKGATLRDVTGQAVHIDSSIFDASPAPAALTAGKQDLAAYWAVQTLRRPSEVWQSERIDLTTGEVLRRREFVKRFTAAGQQWLGVATFKANGKAWVGERAYTITPAVPGASGLRDGVRVWPRKK